MTPSFSLFQLLSRRIQQVKEAKQMDPNLKQLHSLIQDSIRDKNKTSHEQLCHTSLPLLILFDHWSLIEERTIIAELSSLLVPQYYDIKTDKMVLILLSILIYQRV